MPTELESKRFTVTWESGDDYAESRFLKLFPEATDLVVGDHDPDGAEVRLAPVAAAQWSLMRDAAFSEGIVLLAYSGFRSVERQAMIIQNKISKGQSLDSILRLVAAPGFSEHHTGRAVDIGTTFEPPLEEGFAQTSAYLWLTQHAKSFGFRLSFPRGNASPE